MVDMVNGSRLTTYVTPDTWGSRVCRINSAAAHLMRVGHVVIVISYFLLGDASACSYEPRVVLVNVDNAIVETGGESGQAPSGHGLRSSGEPIVLFRK